MAVMTVYDEDHRPRDILLSQPDIQVTEDVKHDLPSDVTSVRDGEFPSPSVAVFWQVSKFLLSNISFIFVSFD